MESQLIQAGGIVYQSVDAIGIASGGLSGQKRGRELEEIQQRDMGMVEANAGHLF